MSCFVFTKVGYWIHDWVSDYMLLLQILASLNGTHMMRRKCFAPILGETFQMMIRELHFKDTHLFRNINPKVVKHIS